MASHAAGRGRFAEAVAHARPILDGRLACATKPKTTYPLVLYPLVRLGRLDEAMQYHRRGYPLVEHDPPRYGAAGQHMMFLALTGNHAKAANLFERHFPAALASVDPQGRFHFLRNALFTLRRIAESGRPALRLVLPPTFPVWNDEGRYALKALTAWVRAEAADLAGQFDRRNGNDSFARKLRKAAAWARHVTPYPPPEATP